MRFNFFVVAIVLATTVATGRADPPVRADGRPLQHPLRKDSSSSHSDSDDHHHGGHSHGWHGSSGGFYAPRSFSYYSYGPLIGGYHDYYYSAPSYGYFCGVCGSPYCTDPYCTGPIYYSLPPRWVTPGEAGYPDPFEAERRFRALAARAGAGGAVPRGVPVNVVPKRADGVAMGDGQDVAADDAIARRVAAIEPAGAVERGRADRLIQEGDDLFQRQAYLGAEKKYRSAVKVAGDYVTARYRLAHALLSRGKYDEALQEFLTAIELVDTIARPDFRLDELYGGNQLAVEADFDALSQAALQRPDDGALLMLVGLMLHYDQQPLRARPFFLRAAQLDGPWTRYAEWFVR